jgi:hypothetical protein
MNSSKHEIKSLAMLFTCCMMQSSHMKIQFEFMLEDFLTMMTCVRAVTIVLILMILIARFIHHRHNHSMCTLMSMKIRCSIECFRTYTTGIRFCSCMSQFMSGKIARLTKCSIAYITDERLLTRMNTLETKR